MRMWFIRNQQTDGWICSLFISNSWIRSSPVGTVLVTELAPWSHPLEVPMKPPTSWMLAQWAVSLFCCGVTVQLMGDAGPGTWNALGWKKMEHCLLRSCSLWGLYLGVLKMKASTVWSSAWAVFGPQAMFTIPHVHWNVELSSLVQIMFGF